MRTAASIATLFVVTILASCAASRSLTYDYAVQHAVITVSDSLTISGLVVRNDIDAIAIAVAGTTQVYPKRDIKRYELVMVPSENSMTQDIVRNTSSTSSGVGVLVGISLASIAVSLAIILSN